MKMKTRAAILPLPGDPMMFTLWLHFFDQWGQYIDKLYVYLNTPSEPAVVNYIRDLCNQRDNISLLINPLQIDHGECINRTLDIVEEELVMLVEDDCFIWNPAHIDGAFQYLESGEYDMVGSPRMSCSEEILSVAANRWGLDYRGEGDKGPNFWPNLFITEKRHLIETDRNFCSRRWIKGERLEALDHVVQSELVNGDTFVNTSLQLRNKGLRVKEIPQYHGATDDYDDYMKGRNIFDRRAGWIHVGSLSSGVSGVLTDPEGRSLSRRLVDPVPLSNRINNYCDNDQEKLEWERRVCWWKMSFDYYMFSAKNVSNGMSNYAGLYGAALNRIIEQYGLDTHRMEKRIAVYKTLFNIYPWQ